MKAVISVVAIALGLVGLAAAGTKQHAAAASTTGEMSDPSGNWATGRNGYGGWGWGYDVSTGLVFVGLPLLLLIPLLFCLPYLLHGGHGHHGGHHGGHGGGGGGYGGAGGYGRSDAGSAAAATIQRRTDQLTQQILPKL